MWYDKYNDGNIPMWTGLGSQERIRKIRKYFGESMPESVLMVSKNQSYKNSILLLLRIW